MDKIENFNLKYDPTEVYSDFESSDLEYKDKSILLGLDTTSSTAISNISIPNTLIHINAELATSSVHTAMDQNYDSLCSLYVASK